jgi:predicted Zn-dependent peptidase
MSPVQPTHFCHGGIDTLVAPLPSAASVTVSVFLDVGLVDEPTHVGGISHFLEHMCFRGTHKRSAYEITKAVDDLGGYVNAYTTKELTCYYITVLPESLPEGVAILFDAVFDSVHDAASVALEKGIITEEIHMYDDTPDEKIMDVLQADMFPDHYLGRPILGTAETVAACTSDAIKQHYAHYFVPGRIKCVVAGAFHQPLTQVMDIIKSAQDRILSRCRTAIDPAVRLTAPKGNLRRHVEKDLEQMHTAYGFKGAAYRDPNAYAVTMLATLLGGSMSSRLFQSVRETKGLAYAIYCSATRYKTTGSVIIYAGTSVANVAQAEACIDHELDRLCQHGIDDDEFNRTYCQLKGQTIIQMEGSSAWANWLGRQLIYQTNMRTMDDLQTALRGIQKSTVESLARDMFGSSAGIRVSLGPSRP